MLSGIRMETGKSVGVHLLDKHVHIARKHAIIAVIIACIPVIACLGPLIYFLTQTKDGSLNIGAIVLLIFGGGAFLLLLVVCCIQPFQIRRVTRYRKRAMLSPSISWRLDDDEWNK